VVADDAHELHRREMAPRRGEERARAAEHVVGFAERRLDRIERDGSHDEDCHLESCLFPVDGASESVRPFSYMRSGAAIPSSDSPLRNTICAARASTSRAFWIESGSLSTCALWYHRWTRPAVSCR